MERCGFVFIANNTKQNTHFYRTYFSMRLRTLVVMALMMPAVVFAETNKEVDLVPKIHGAIRTRFENEFHSDIKRFQVANARISLNGMVAPSIDYFVQIDACDRGKMKFLDAWGRIAITSSLKLQAGQFRRPFGVEPFRSPATYVFANRSFVGKTLGNYRGVGAKLSYAFKTEPLTLEAGAFNTTSISDHTVKNTQLSFASRILWNPDGWTVETGFLTQAPYGKRVNLFDVALGWKNSDWEFLGECMTQSYTHSDLSTTYGYVFWGQRFFPVEWGVFNRASVQARFDGLTSMSDGSVDDNNAFVQTEYARNRITVGGTVTYTYKKVHADIRLNYEKYFYKSGAVIADGLNDKIVAELVIRF